jgi:hypothetical protein
MYFKNDSFLVLGKVVLTYIIDPYAGVIMDLRVSPVLLPVLSNFEFNISIVW